MPQSSYKLQLTKGFFADFHQVARALAFSVANKNFPRISPQLFVDSIGVSASRMENLNSLAVAFGLMNSTTLTPTKLGLVVHEHDPYLDDIGTLWLLHYVVSSSERYVVWNRLVNRVIPENDQFSTTLARPYFDDLRQHYSDHSMDRHISKEIGVVWNAYTEQAFRHLDYIRRENELLYVHGYLESVPPRIFYAAILKFRQERYTNATTLEISRLAGAENSPGRIFGLSHRQSLDLFEQIKQLGLLYVETRADLDQIRLRDDARFLDAVRSYYGEN